MALWENFRMDFWVLQHGGRVANMSFVARSRSLSHCFGTSEISLRNLGSIGSRLVSSNSDGSSSGKGKKLDLKSLLNKLKEGSDQDTIKPKHLLEKWKAENEQERVEVRSRLFNSTGETEKGFAKTEVGEGVKISSKPHHDGFKKPSQSREMTASLSNMFQNKSAPRVKSDVELDKKVKNILSELKVEAGQSGLSKGIVGAVRMWGNSAHKIRSGVLIEEYYDQFREGGTNEESRGKEISFKSGPRSHLFDKTFKEGKGVPSRDFTLFEQEQSNEIEKLKRMDIGTNDFEEMMKIADRQWKFPVDNEIVKASEEKVGFEEHVFLEYLLDEFPEKGPVRQFMELVISGLQMNPHLSVKQKKDQVFWFKEYFSSFPEADLNF